MRKTHTGSKKKSAADAMQPEYQFDYRKARPNRFAQKIKSGGGRLILLDADVAKAFTTPESVNAVLRALLRTMPERSSQ
jgi:hypothetical protein